MAHTDACKFQVCEFVKKCVDNGMSVSAATKEAERESDGIPAETVRRWWKTIQNEAQRGLVKNDQPPQTPANSEHTPNSNEIKRAKDGSLRGGPREGAGRKKRKYEDQIEANCAHVSEAMDFAMMAISHLERIRPKDPRRQEALERVESWVANNK